MKVSELIEALSKADPDHIVVLGARNAPPWIQEFTIDIQPPEEE